MEVLIEDLRENLERINERLGKTIIYEFDKVSNPQAKQMVEIFLKRIKKDMPMISVFEISQKLRLPADQVEDILEKLSKEKKVRFNDE